jgi:6-phosphofructokinase
VYLRLKNFGETAKKIRVAGRVLLVAAIALDVIELCKTIDADLKNSDKKLGRKTVSNI